MNTKQLAKALEAQLKFHQGTPQEFLLSIPGSVNLKENTNEYGVHSIQVMLSPTCIVKIETNGKDVLVTSLM